MHVGLSPSSESSTQDEVLGAGCGLAGFEAEHWEQSQTSALYVGKAALPTRPTPEWLCCNGVWGGDRPLAKEGLRISTAEKRRSSELPGAIFWPCVSHSGHTGKAQGAPCPSWLIGTFLLQSSRLKLPECTRN